MNVGERKTFDARISAGVWGVEGDAVQFTTPTVGRAAAEVRAVRPGTAIVFFAFRDSAIPRAEFPVEVEAPPARPGQSEALRPFAEEEEARLVAEREAQERARVEEEARLAAERERLRASAEEAARVEGDAEAAKSARPAPADDARTLRNSKPGPEDDEEVAEAARRLRSRRDEGQDGDTLSEAATADETSDERATEETLLSTDSNN